MARTLQDSDIATERTIRNIRDYESHMIGLDDRNRSVLRRSFILDTLIPTLRMHGILSRCSLSLSLIAAFFYYVNLYRWWSAERSRRTYKGF